jgi:hypothetical protein
VAAGGVKVALEALGELAGLGLEIWRVRQVNRREADIAIRNIRTRRKQIREYRKRVEAALRAAKRANG